MGSRPEGGAPITVLVVDDHALVREGTRTILERDPDIAVVGEAETGESAVQLAANLCPDVMLVDVHLPDINGIAVASRMNDESPGTKVLILTAYPDADYVRAAVAAGAEGYLLKTAATDELAAAVHAAADGLSIPSSLLSGRTFGIAAAKGGPDTSVPSSGAEGEPELTARETEVVALLAEGLPNKAIAHRLGISRRTVEGHISRVFSKVGASCRTELVRYAIQHELIVLGPLRR